MKIAKLPTEQDRAKVVLFPPLVGLGLFLLGIGLHLALPTNVFADGWPVLAAGLLILALGAALQVICVRALKSAKTTPLFKKPTTQILRRGPYGKSRNPIYVAVVLQFLGLSLIFNSMWLLVTIPVLFLYLHFGVIAGEERYLEQKFEEEYTKYKSEVPRWI